MNKKEFYTTPEVDVLVVRFEGEICVSGDGGTESGSIVDGPSWDY